MRGPAVLLVLALAAAGCASPGPGLASSPSSSQSESLPPGTHLSQPFTPLPPTFTENVSVDGHVGAQGYLCHPEVPGRCVGANASPEDAGVVFGDEGAARLVAANLTATWAADSPATARMALEVRLLRDDQAILVAHADGPSPLVLRNASLDAPLQPGAQVRAFVYNAGGYVPAGGGFAYATPDQAVHLEGTLTFAR